MNIKAPWFLFHPRVTFASLIAITGITAVHVATLISAKPLLVLLFGATTTQGIIDFLTKTGAACGLLTIILAWMAAYGRSPAPSVDNDIRTVVVTK